MSTMAAELERQLGDSTYRQLDFEERLALLVDAEWSHRQSNKLNRLIRGARFSAPSATIEGIEYHDDRKLDKAQILRFATCAYIDEGHLVLLFARGSQAHTRPKRKAIFAQNFLRLRISKSRLVATSTLAEG